MLDLLEPRFEENYDAEKAHYNKNIAKKSKKIEIKQLTKKYKKELRGTVRELRRDNQFLNRYICCIYLIFRVLNLICYSFLV